MFTICGHTLTPGQKKQTALRPLSGYEMPATLVCGAKPGKTILITAGIHAGEYPGVPAVIRLAKDVDPAQVAGNIVMIHCVNTSGFWARTDCIVAEDGGNLNANYPGSPDGTVSQRIANYFVAQIFPYVDFVADLHSGSQQEPLTPCLFFPKGETVRRQALEAAKALDIPYLIQSEARTGEYSYAAHAMGIPALLLERGHSGFCEEEWIEAYRNDLRLLLNCLGCYPYDKSSVVEKRIFVRTIYLEAEEDGVWYCNVKPGETVKKGRPLGRMEDFYGNLLHEYCAEADGVVFYHCCGLSVKAGRNLAAYGVEEAQRPIENRIERRVCSPSLQNAATKNGCRILSRFDLNGKRSARSSALLLE